jgi:hypothetical protein
MVESNINHCNHIIRKKKPNKTNDIYLSRRKKREFYQLYTRQIKKQTTNQVSVFFPTHVKERKCPNSVLVVYLETISDENAR